MPDNGGRPVQFEWFIDNVTTHSEWDSPLNASTLLIPQYYLKSNANSLLNITLKCTNSMGLYTVITHTVRILNVDSSVCDNDLLSISIDHGNIHQIHPNWHDYPISVSIKTRNNMVYTRYGGYNGYTIRWQQIFAPNTISDQFHDFEPPTLFRTNSMEWKHRNKHQNDTIVIPMYSTKHSNDYLLTVTVCTEAASKFCLSDWVWIRSKYPMPIPVTNELQIEYINPVSFSIDNIGSTSLSYRFGIDRFFHFHPLFLAQYDYDFGAIYGDGEFSWTFQCFGITQLTTTKLPVSCTRGIEAVVTKESIINKKFIRFNITAILTVSGSFPSIYELQRVDADKVYPKVIRSHTIMFVLDGSGLVSVCDHVM